MSMGTSIEQENLIAVLEEDRLQTASLVANEIVHRFNGAIDQIRGRAEKLNSTLQYQQKEMMSGILHDLEGLESLVSSIKGMVEVNLGVSESVNLFDQVEELILFFQYRLSASKIQVMNMVPPQVAAKVNPTHLRQILMATLINSIESLENLEKDKSRLIMIHGQIQPNSKLKTNELFVHIEDSGIGLRPEVQAKLFHPFNTNKKGHVGLSLAVCKRIAQIEKWNFKLKSPKPGSTQFELVIPI